MTITLKSIIKGHSIKLPDSVQIEDGTQVIVNIETEKEDSNEKKRAAEKLCGSWADDPSIDEIFDRIEKERHIYWGRERSFNASA